LEIKNLQKEAYRLRFEFYNLYEEKENKWHQKYKNHMLYDIVVESFQFKFNEIGEIMPKLLQKIDS
jgi:hypothetical protein